jgi:hypothetical protein
MHGPSHASGYGFIFFKYEIVGCAIQGIGVSQRGGMLPEAFEKYATGSVSLDVCTFGLYTAGDGGTLISI